MKDEKKKHNWVQLELWPETKTPQGGGSDQPGNGESVSV
jgi:hypothetical protein